MRVYGILRRDGWRSTSELEHAALRSSAEGERMADEVAWIYQASSPEAIRRHASAAALPVDEILEVADVVVVRPDPVAQRPTEGVRAEA